MSMVVALDGSMGLEFASATNLQVKVFWVIGVCSWFLWLCGRVRGKLIVLEQNKGGQGCWAGKFMFLGGSSCSSNKVKLRLDCSFRCLHLGGLDHTMEVFQRLWIWWHNVDFVLWVVGLVWGWWVRWFSWLLVRRSLVYDTLNLE